MNKWLFLAAAFGGLLGCSDQDLSDEDMPEVQAQQTAADGGASPTPSKPSTSIDGSAAIAPTTDSSALDKPGSIGAACMADGDCTTAGTRCVKTVEIPFGGLSIQFPNGYCSKSCTAADQCGAGVGCPLSQAAAFLPDISQCLKVCKAASDCRQGYSCTTLPAFPGFGGAAPAAPAGPAATHCLPPLPFPG